MLAEKELNVVKESIASLAYLEKLNPNDSKHELQQEHDQHDVVDGAHSHNHTLHHVLYTQKGKQKVSHQTHNTAKLGC